MSSLSRFCGALAAALMLGLTFSVSQPVQAQSTTVVISELRTRGPGTTGAANGTANDEFVEITNVSGGSLDISGYKLRGSNAAGTIGDRATVPAATTLPPGGHYLFTNSTAGGYSLATYPAGNGTTATGNTTFGTGITDDGGVAITLADNTILDQVGMSAAVPAAFREGTPLAPTTGTGTNQFSYVRRTTTGGPAPQDTNDNSADFVLVATSGSANGLTAVLGAPGPENLSSPVQRNAAIKTSLVNGSVSASASPNRVRSSSGANPTNAAFGTLSIQRRFTNNTPDPITRLRFRAVDITTLNTPVVIAPQADLRVLSSTGTVTDSQGNTVTTVTGLTLETPPAQAIGGGLNSSLTAIPPGGALAPGATLDVQFLLGVQAEGNFRFFVNVEALPATSSAPPAATGVTKVQARSKTRADGNK